MRYTWIVMCLAFFGIALFAMSAVSALEPLQITSSVEYESYLDISDRYIIWVDYSTGNSELYAYNIQTRATTRITNNQIPDDSPELYQDRLVWRQNYGALRYRNLTTGGEIEVFPQDVESAVSIYDDFIIFANRTWDTGGPVYNFQCYQISTSKLSIIFIKQANNLWLEDAAVYNNKAVWVFSENGKGFILQADLPSGTSFVKGFPSNTDKCQFAGIGDFIVCKSSSSLFKYELKFAKIDPLNLIALSMDSDAIDVSGNDLLFLNMSEDMTFNFDLYVYHFDTQQTTRLTYDRYMEAGLAISNDKVAFISNRNGFMDVYFFQIPTNPPDIACEAECIKDAAAMPYVAEEPFALNVAIQNKGTSLTDVDVVLWTKDSQGMARKYTKGISKLGPGMTEVVTIDKIVLWNLGYASFHIIASQPLGPGVVQEINLGNNELLVTRYVTDRPMPVIESDYIEGGACTVSELHFSGVNSTDREGITMFIWDFGDGSTGFGQDVAHAWRDSGLFKVTLTAYDIYGIRNSTVLEVEMCNQLPVPVYTVPIEVPRNVSVILSAAGSYDPDGKIVDTYWEIGPGDKRGERLYGTVVEYLFSFPEPNVTVVLHLVDDDREETTMYFDVLLVESTAHNIPPIALIQMSGSSGNLTFSGQNSYDPNGKITSYTWTFGNGTTKTGSVVNYQFGAEGTYFVSLKVLDNEGLDGTTSVAVTIDYTAPPTIIQQNYGNTTVINQVKGNIAPTINGASFTTQNGTSDKGKVDFKGWGSDKDGTITKYEWDFNGDGVWDYSNGANGNTTYTYDKPAFYVAIFRVTDNNGTSAVTMLSIGIKTDEIGTKPTAKESKADTSFVLLLFIICLVMAISIAAAVGYVMSKKVATIKKDEAAEQEVAEIRKLVDESKATGANIDEAEALIKQYEGR